MDFEQAAALINGDHSAFAPRTVSNAVPWAVYIETATGGKRRPHNSNRWQNNGGKVGSVTWPAKNAWLRRKYGTITPMKEGCISEKLLNFIAYSHVHAGSDPVGADGVTVYQAVPRPQRAKSSNAGGPTALSFEEAERLLCSGDEGGVLHLSAWPDHLVTSAAGRVIFFERQMWRRPRAADRWNTSGGVKGSTVWPSEGLPRVRRRYGKITQRDGPSLCYVVYSQIGDAPAAAGVEHRRDLRGEEKVKLTGSVLGFALRGS
jgi:hypothetical protein